MFAKKPLNLDSKSPRAARQPRFLQICHHTSNGPMNYESISKVLNHNIPQVGGHMAATADLSYYKKHKGISCYHFILEIEQVKQGRSFILDTSSSG